jgi:hypothetical protein
MTGASGFARVRPFYVWYVPYRPGLWGMDGGDTGREVKEAASADSRAVARALVRVLLVGERAGRSHLVKPA